MERLTFFLSKSMSMIFGVDHVADSQDISNFCDVLVGDLGDVNQAVNAGDDLCKRTKSGDGDDLDRNDHVNGVVAFEDFPGVVFALLVAQGDFFLLGVDVFDVYFDVVANVNHFFRGFDSGPGELGDVNHTVNAAQINKRTVGGDGFDFAVVDLADFHICPEFFLFCFLCFHEHSFDGTDCTTASVVDFDYLKLYFLLEKGDLSLRRGDRKSWKKERKF